MAPLFKAALISASLLVACPAFSAGWDNNLVRRCVATTGVPGNTNYYDDRSGCPTYTPPGSPLPKHWLIGIQTENAEGGQACTGPNDRSFVVNAPGSPVKLSWMPHQSDIGPNWSVNMVVDQSSNPPACAGNVWTWYSFQDNQGSGGGPLPNANVFASSHIINYNQWVQSSNDGARMIATAAFFWGGKAHTIEIDLASINQTYPSKTPGLLLSKIVSNGNEFIVIDGNYWGVKTNVGVDTFVYIPWYSILQSVVNRGWFTGSPNLANATTGSVGLAVEVRNKGIANLWHTNFRTGP